MTSRSKWKIFVAVVIGIGVPYCMKNWVLSPHANPAPTQRIVMHGTFPFDKGLSLEFNVSYRSHNPTCKQTARAFVLFAAAEVDQRTYAKAAVKDLGNNKYEAEIFLDLIEPGFCEWEYAGVGYGIRGKEFSGSHTVGLGAIPLSEKSANLQCRTVLLSETFPTDRSKTYHCSKTISSQGDKSLSPAELNFTWKEE